MHLMKPTRHPVKPRFLIGIGYTLQTKPFSEPRIYNIHLAECRESSNNLIFRLDLLGRLIYTQS